MSEFIVREPVLEELSNIMPLVKGIHYDLGMKRYVLFEDAVDDWEAWLKTAIANETGNVFFRVIEDEGEIGALIVCVCNPIFFCPSVKIGFELMFYVDPEKRRKGYGKTLIDKYCEWAKGQDCKFVTIGANKGYKIGWKPTKTLYESLGFTLEEKHYIRSL